MPVPIAELFVSVGADISGATNQLNQLNSQLNRVGANATGGGGFANLAKNLRSAGSQAKTVGADLTATLTAPLLAVGAAVFSAGSDFESSFAQVKRTVNDLDPSQLEDLRQSLLDMSKTSAGGGQTADNLAEIASVGGQLGLSGGEVKSFTSLVARLALATNLPAGEIGDDIGRSIKIMGLGQDQYESFGATVAELGNIMGGTEADIFEFSRRMAATLGALGVTPAKILAIGSALAEAGVNPEAGATAINKFFVEMVNSLNETGGASEEAKQKLQSLKDTVADLSGNLEVAQLRQREFGRNTPASVVKANQIAIDKYSRELGQANTKLSDFADTGITGKLSIAGMAKVANVSEDAFRALVKTDPAQAFAQFVAGLQAVTKAGGPDALTKALEDLGITDERQREALLALAQSAKSLPTALEGSAKAWDEQRALQDEVAKQFETTATKAKVLGNAVNVELIGAFDKQHDAIQKTIDQLTNDLPAALNKLSGAVPALDSNQLAILGGIGAAGPALLAVGAALQIVAGAIGIIAAIGAVPILVVVGSIAGLVLVFDSIANHWDAVKGIWESSPNTAGFAVLIDFFKKNGETIKQVFRDIVTVVQTWDFNKELTAALATAGAIFSAFGEFLSKFFDTVLLPILMRFKGWIAEHILGAMVTLLQGLQQLGITNLPGVGDIGQAISNLQAQQAGATAAAGGSEVNVTINNPVVTSQGLLDDMIAKAQAAMAQGLIMAERSVTVPPQPLPGQTPGTPF